MNRINGYFIITVWIIAILSCCSPGKGYDAGTPFAERTGYTIYLMNRGYTRAHRPVNDLSRGSIKAMACFENAGYVDFGWGDEEVYQARHETFCMDLRAVTIPSSSVMRVEVFPGDPDSMSYGSDYTIMFTLDEQSFRKLCAWIDSSFMLDENGQLIRTSVRAGGDIIFFRSVHTYCGLNTCNTWDADALHASGLDVSSFLVITERDSTTRLR